VNAEVVVIRTGMANLASVVAALQRLGAEPLVTTDPNVVRRARRVVLPGVGAFGAAMEAMRTANLVEPVVAHVRAERPLLAICLGLQILCEQSEESPGIEGLGVVPGTVRRFGPGVHVPQLGWNRVVPSAGSKLLREGYAYYANSYRLEALPTGWEGATTVHGGSFVAAVERGALLACQFHPELSSSWGRALLERWLTTGEE